MDQVLSQLRVAHRERANFEAHVQEAKDRCAKDHNSVPLVECEDCYHAVIAAFEGRIFHPSSTERKAHWYHGRRLFLADLERVFLEAKRFDLDPRAIETRIQKEKELWYQENVVTAANRFIVDDTTIRDDILDKVYEQTLAFDDLVQDIRQALTRVCSPPLDAASVVERLLSVTEHTPDCTRIYEESFFGVGHDEQTGSSAVPGSAQKYIERLRAEGAMQGIIEQILEDRQASVGARIQKDKHLRRLDELRRGRTAHELQKTKKTRNRDAAPKTRADVTDVPKELYDLPPCTVCSAPVDPGDYLSCVLCQVLVGRHLQTDLTVYCSDTCYTHGHDPHVEAAHSCAAGGKCVQLHDEDMDMENDENPRLCQECMDSLGTVAIFCSIRCAEANFQSHREQVHVPKREEAGLVTEDLSRIVFDDGEQTRYHAANIHAEVISLDEAFRELANGTSIHVSPIK
ncbi:hypothetical protein VTK73DRAFT_8946 [Phialemonium thermophilum]|uniref:Uncharacterized protein n=1 Tax=Phialemonium thermophilum TaxID=223376 RepID=A0ABR3Y5T7_9PEZI